MKSIYPKVQAWLFSFKAYIRNNVVLAYLNDTPVFIVLLSVMFTGQDYFVYSLLIILGLLFFTIGYLTYRNLLQSLASYADFLRDYVEKGIYKDYDFAKVDLQDATVTGLNFEKFPVWESQLYREYPAIHALIAKKKTPPFSFSPTSYIGLMPNGGSIVVLPSKPRNDNVYQKFLFYHELSHCYGQGIREFFYHNRLLVFQTSSMVLLTTLAAVSGLWGVSGISILILLGHFYFFYWRDNINSFSARELLADLNALVLLDNPKEQYLIVQHLAQSNIASWNSHYANFYNKMKDLIAGYKGDRMSANLHYLYRGIRFYQAPDLFYFTTLHFLLCGYTAAFYIEKLVLPNWLVWVALYFLVRGVLHYYHSAQYANNFVPRWNSFLISLATDDEKKIEQFLINCRSDTNFIVARTMNDVLQGNTSA